MACRHIFRFGYVLCDNSEGAANMGFFNEKIASEVPNPIMFLPDSRANAEGYGSFFN